jgi:hypothetical protein
LNTLVFSSQTRVDSFVFGSIYDIKLPRHPATGTANCVTLTPCLKGLQYYICFENGMVAEKNHIY